MSPDWRLQNLQDRPYLRGVAFTRKPYRAYREGWDHDHCAACAVTLTEVAVEGDDVVHEGYATTAAYVRGLDYEWVCAPCFTAFREMMDWREEAGVRPAVGASSE